jgi:hypothetical protein
MILLFGAEFTQQWATQRGSGIRPEKGAVRVVETEEIVRPGEDGAAGGKGAKSGKAGKGGGKGGKGGNRPLPAAASGRAKSGPVTTPEPAKSGGLMQLLLGVPVFLMFMRRKGDRGDDRK